MSDLETLKRETCDRIDALAPELIDISHQIHAKPELAFQEHFAAGLLADALEKHDLTTTRNAFGLDTAYASSFGEGKAEVGILSEYDALPGIGHACGHNIIATTGLGAALGLSALNGRLPGRIRYLGTPAEEMGGGKELMAQEGAFDGLDAAMMVHPAGIDLETMPCICVSEVRVTYHGKSAHASAMPHAGINALDALVTAYQTLAQLRQHIRPSERIHGIFTETGLAPNIVPDRASGLFYVRAKDANDLADLKKRVQACFDAGAISSGCHADVEWAKADYLDMKTSFAISQAYVENAKSLGREFIDLNMLPSSSAGSTDMGNVSHRVPSIHPMISCAPANVVIHNPEFAKWAGSDLGDKAVVDGAKALAMTALDFLTSPDMQAQAKADFEASADVSREAVSKAYNPDGLADIGGCGCC